MIKVNLNFNIFKNSLILKNALLSKHLIHQIDGFRLLAVNDL